MATCLVIVLKAVEEAVVAVEVVVAIVIVTIADRMVISAVIVLISVTVEVLMEHQRYFNVIWMEMQGERLERKLKRSNFSFYLKSIFCLKI